MSDRQTPMNRQEATKLLREALHRLESDDPNPRLGGVYWRLADVLRKYVDPLLDDWEGSHAEYVRRHHPLPETKEVM